MIVSNTDGLISPLKLISVPLGRLISIVRLSPLRFFDDPALNVMAEGFEVTQNSPNPFTKSTTISYKLSETATVSIKGYDMMGKVFVVANTSVISEGLHPVVFNSESLSSGIYYYALEVNGKIIDTKKMVIK